MNYDHDRGDWEHECKRDKNLDRIADLEAQVAKLTEDNDKAHELAEHYRDANYKLRQALTEITLIGGDGVPSAVARIARKALKEVKS